MNLMTTVLLEALMVLVTAAASAKFGFVSGPVPGTPVWVVPVALTADYWVVFIRQVRC